MNQIVSSQDRLKLSLLAGSYDTFLAFFGLSNLTAVSDDFYGLPDYASTMAFELFTVDNVASFPSSTDDLRVRFLFRNGTTEGDVLTTFPLFGGQEGSLSYSDFVSGLERVCDHDSRGVVQYMRRFSARCTVSVTLRRNLRERATVCLTRWLESLVHWSRWGWSAS